MSTSLDVFESALVGMRDPLARVTLAVGRLTAGSDAGQGALLRSIREAVSEIDARIEDLLGGLAAGAPSVAADTDLCRALSDVVADLEPALFARSLNPRLAALPDVPPTGDASLLRRAVCRLLLGLSHWAEGDPGEVELGLRVGDDGRIAVELDVELRPEVERPRRGALGPLEGLAASREISLEPRHVTGSRLGVTAWLRGAAG